VTRVTIEKLVVETTLKRELNSKEGGMVENAREKKKKKEVKKYFEKVFIGPHQ